MKSSLTTRTRSTKLGQNRSNKFEFRFGEPHELDDWWKKAFSKFNFNPDKRHNLSDDELSEYYKVARDSKILRHKTEDLLAQVKALIKTSEAIASGSAGVDSQEVS